MPNKKKAVKNAYFFFMEKYRDDRNRKNPGRPITIPEAASLCSPLWQSMTPEEKKVYEDMAKKDKLRVRGMPETKYTTTGLVVSDVEKKDKEMQEKSMRMKQEIKTCVESLDEESLLNHRFYFIHANFFCQCDDGDYIPAEVGVSCFTLKNGVEKYYHSMINPGDLPIGYTYKAQKNSEDTHGIPIPPSEVGEHDFSKLFRDIFLFVVRDGAHDQIPPLYTVNEFEPGVSNLLSKLTYAAGRPEKVFKVYDLVQLFFNLKNKAASLAGKEGFPVYCLAETEIENDAYAYTKEICCYWHEGSEGPQYCSLSRARRWGFHIADHCCKDLDVELIPGQHLPTTDKYFNDLPVETFQSHWNTKKRTLNQPAPRTMADPASSEPEYKPLRQPRSMGIALGQVMPASVSPLEKNDEQFPPLGRRIGANFGKNVK